MGTRSSSVLSTSVHETPEEGHVGVPGREHLQQCVFARGPMGAVATIAGMLRMLGAIIMNIGVLVETYLVEQQLFGEAVGVPVEMGPHGVPVHFQPVEPMQMPLPRREVNQAASVEDNQQEGP